MNLGANFTALTVRIFILKRAKYPDGLELYFEKPVLVSIFQ
jgi:hypothetical protein